MKSALRPTKRRKDDYFLQTLGKVPMDMWTYIFHFLTNDEIISLRVLSKSWKDVVERSSIWEQRFMKLYSKIEFAYENNEFFEFVRFTALGHYDMESASGKDWMRSLYYLNCFGLFHKLDYSIFYNYKNGDFLKRFALFLSRKDQTQFLSHWMFAIYKCRLRQSGAKLLYECDYDDLCFTYFWELGEDTKVVFKDLSKFQEQTICVEVHFEKEDIRKHCLITYQTNAKPWNFYFDKAKFDIREEGGGYFDTPHDAFIDQTVFAGLVATIKLYQSPFHEMSEEARAVCTKMLNTNFEYVYVT